MARPIFCQVEGCPEEAGYLLTDIEGGETVTMCPEHWTDFLLGAAETMGMQFPDSSPDDTVEVVTGRPDWAGPDAAAIEAAYNAQGISLDGPEPEPEPEPKRTKKTASAR